MQKIMEPIFEIPYLIGAVLLGILIIINAKGRKQYILFGVMAIVLGAGDAFHLIPRMYALLSDGLENHLFALGLGKLITSITMTVFYCMLYHIYCLRYNKNNMALTILIYFLALTRIVLCSLPQNNWFTESEGIAFNIYRNIPFVVLGAVIIYLFFIQAKKNNDKHFKFMWLAILLSFAFYIPVVLGADAVPLLGMLMIPKTCAYVWIIIMGFLASREKPETIIN